MCNDVRLCSGSMSMCRVSKSDSGGRYGSNIELNSLSGDFGRMNPSEIDEDKYKDKKRVNYR